MWMAIVACLVGAPQKCVHVTLGESSDVMGCMIESITKGAAWADAHPGYEIKSLDCVDDKPTEGEDL